MTDHRTNLDRDALINVLLAAGGVSISDSERLADAVIGAGWTAPIPNMIKLQPAAYEINGVRHELPARTQCEGSSHVIADADAEMCKCGTLLTGLTEDGRRYFQ